MHPPSPALPPPKFHLHRTDCSYGLWIQTMTALANQFLSPSDNEQWYCPDLIDFPKLTVFGDKDSEKQHGSFIPTVTKTPHPESTIVRGLFQLLHPPQRLHTDWARIVAASIELMAENLFRPPPPVSHHEVADHITHGVAALSFLDAVKSSSSSFAPATSVEDPSVPPAKRLHSTHYLSEAPLTAAEKKANLRANQMPLEGTTASPAPVEQTPSALATESAEATQSLKKYQRKQNYQPLVYFVLAGVRGLFITSRDHRIAGLSTCMSFIQAMSIIKQHTTTTHAPDEPIWKNLSAYLFQVFLPVFQSLDKICPLNNVKVPTRVELAEAITSDFLNQWQEWNPTSSFLLPHTTPQIAGPAH
ncbi:hypothetical protein PtB15_6B143 [Puccinia triticina]|nr:hypothetical protein PtB15_6B143 [Puccinia triticina]